jgi:hypothetical protein
MKTRIELERRQWKRFLPLEFCHTVKVLAGGDESFRDTDVTHIHEDYLIPGLPIRSVPANSLPTVH